MRIGIDGHHLGGSSGGNETVLTSLLDTLGPLAPEHTFVVFYTQPHYRPPRTTANVTYRRLWPSHALWRQAGGLGLAARRQRVDALLSFYWSPLLFPGSRQLLSIHDVGHRYFPEHFTTRRRLQLEVAVRSGIARAKHIVTLTEHSKHTIAESYGVPLERITVTYCGVDTSFYRPAPPERIAAVKRRLGIDRDYLLHVGNLMPRKNLAGLIEAFGLLKRETRLDHVLVIVGRRRWLTGAIFDAAARSGLSDDIVFTGYVPTDELPALYSGAALYVMPSYFEGFGIPVIEAMACETPVVSSNATSLPEIIGEAGLLFDPTDAAEMAAAMARALGDAELCATLVARGSEQVRRFTTEECARRYLAALAEVAAG